MQMVHVTAVIQNKIDEIRRKAALSKVIVAGSDEQLTANIDDMVDQAQLAVLHEVLFLLIELDRLPGMTPPPIWSTLN